MLMQHLHGIAAFGTRQFLRSMKALAQLIHEQTVDDFENVGLFGVVRAQLAALNTVHDALEQAAKNLGADLRPVALGACK